MLSFLTGSLLVCVLFQITECTDYLDTAVRHADLLERVGFTRVLNENTKANAINAIKEFYVFYRILGPLHQIIQGNSVVF